MNTKYHPSSIFPKANEHNTKPKIKIPDLSTEIFKDQKLFYQFDTSLSPPPLSTTSCFIHETSNSDPHLIRSTMYTLPNTSKFFENLNIPLGVLITPFSFKSDSRRNLSSTVRCMQCLSYANIHWKIQNQKVICNICKYPNIIQDGSVLQNVIKFATYELNVPYHMETLNKNMIDSQYFQEVIFKCSAFVFVLDATYNYNEEFFTDLGNILKDETFKTLYKRVVFMTSNSIFGSTNMSDIVEFKLDTSSFIPPSVFLETERLNEKFINILFDSIKTNESEIKFYDVLLKISTYCIGSKVIIFSNTITYIKDIPSMTIYYFSSLRYKSDLSKVCCSESFFNLSVIVKTSNGISKNAVYTNSEVENLTNVELSSMDCSSTLTYTFYIDEPITDARVYIQFIVNYCTHDGEYKTLILNQSYKVSKFPYEVYNGVSFDTLFACFCKFISKDVQNIKLVEEIICKYLKYYRIACCKDVSITQFVLPESTKLLPVLYQALVKNKIFSVSNLKLVSKKIDLKNLITFSVEQNLRYFYPRLFTLTDYYMDQDLSKIQYLRLSMSVIDSSEIYVLENGQKIYLYIGKDVDQSLKEGIFKNEEEYAVLMKLLEDINSTYGYELPIVVVEEGKKGGEVDFYGYMIEDNMNGVCSYYDYICELHFKVQKA